MVARVGRVARVARVEGVGMKMVVGGVHGVDMIGGVNMIDEGCEYDGRRCGCGRGGGMEGHAHRERRLGG